MKNKKKYSLVLSTVLLLFLGCKNNDLGFDSFKIDRDLVTLSVDSVCITGSYSFTGTVKSIVINIGEKESLIDANTYEMQLEGTEFSVTVRGLKHSTEYYYRYAVDFGTNDNFLSDIKSFTTLDAVTEKPTVKTWAVLAIDSTTFRIKCEVISDGGTEVTERGICWNTYGDPTIGDDILQDANGGLDIYTIRMEHLALGKTYYVCAYAKNANGFGFGEVLNFSTENEVFPPQVSTIEVIDITYNSATCLCNVISNGGLELIERGVCWSEDANPNMNNYHVAAEGTTLGDFRVTLNLSPNKEYHVRAYAINAKGTTLADEVLTFVTEKGLPIVTTTMDIYDITVISAIGGGNVTNEGASPVTERGICWDTISNPTIDDHHDGNGSGLGTYTVNMTDLSPNKTYYVRAYATNGQGTAYGNQVEFKTLDGLPTVETLEVYNILATSASAQGKVIDQGYSGLTDRGICWSTEHEPIVENYHASCSIITGDGVYFANLTKLAPNTQYYVRAYATNGQGTAYGNEISFKTK